ncbi:hypothetical protein MBANPS3_007381 [Mucor bainieri]
METCFCKEDLEPMLLKQELNFDDIPIMYEDEEECEPFIKVENEESIKGMIVSEYRSETPPPPPAPAPAAARPRQRWRNNATVVIERQPTFDKFFQAKPSPAPVEATIDPYNVQQYSHGIYAGRFKRPHATIDPYHPNNYCAKCDRNFAYNYFRPHLRTIHGLQFQGRCTKASQPLKRPRATVNLHHTKNYCAKCDRTYSQGYLRKHLIYMHNIRQSEHKPRAPRAKLFKDPQAAVAAKKRAPKQSNAKAGRRKLAKARRSKHAQTKTAIASLKPQIQCAQCKRICSSTTALLRHLERVHPPPPPPQQPFKYPDAAIDIFHPDNYCAKCDTTHPSARVFLTHLQSHHLPTLWNTRNSAARKNSRHNAAYYCPKCDRYYTKDIFKQHFTNHRFSRAVIVNPEAAIDLHSPDFYCAKCEHYCGNAVNFRTHVIQQHHLGPEWSRAMKQKRIVYPDAEIDFANSDGYCAKCDKKMGSSGSLVYHAAIVHAAYPPATNDQVSSDLGSCNLRNGKKLHPIYK